eukprot:CAMPEP_0184506054 /NCGR_PEP_ID=MMETSP0113_2-20130426/53303_1 /TAXON_ID=91329 /ORGANISM="Norrisiella sphaerica, Strain BC52" /LENGTH=63 /DNA_ID=CAMNT_0026895757 /DNA_START=401 /DNA_END=592 /DNA_ORIENTATION=+
MTTPNPNVGPVLNPKRGIEMRVASTVEMAFEKPFKMLSPYFTIRATSSPPKELLMPSSNTDQL